MNILQSDCSLIPSVKAGHYFHFSKNMSADSNFSLEFQSGSVLLTWPGSTEGFYTVLWVLVSVVVYVTLMLQDGKYL